MTSRRITIAASATAALFLAVLTLLAVQMARGEDPALGTSDRAEKALNRSARTDTPDVPAPVYGDGSGYDDGSTYDDGSGYDQGSAAVPQQQAEQAPLQSGTS